MGKLSDYIGLTGEAVTLVDTADQFTIDNAESALQELAGQVDTLQSAGSGGLEEVGSLTKTVAISETNSILLSEIAPDPVVTVVKEVPQLGLTNNDWTIETADASFDVEASEPGMFEDGKFIAGVTQELDTKVAVTNATGQIDTNQFTSINSMTPVEADVVAGGFNTVLYDGNATDGHQITGVGFQPDLVWIKGRDVVSGQKITDSVRGAGISLNADGTNADDVDNGVKTLDPDGFTIGPVGASYNGSGNSYVAWCWKAGGTAVTNNDGSIESQVSVNQELGFSIVSYTGTGVNATVGHGLDKTPMMMIIKNRDTVYDWQVYHNSLDITKYLELNQTQEAFVGTNRWNSIKPTSTTFSIGTGGVVNLSDDNLIAYCWAEIPGFSKFGSYTGDGSADGPEIDLGFKPEFIMIKRTDGADSWVMFDRTRGFGSGTDGRLLADSNSIEDNSTDYGELTDTGFKIGGAGYGPTNASGHDYIYMAFGKKVEAKGAKVFDAVKYTGDGTSAHEIKTGFQPDLVWLKARNQAWNHYLNDSVRGPAYHLYSSETNAQTTSVGEFNSFDSDGFTVSGIGRNSDGQDFIGWCWKKDPSCGLDIVQYTGTSATQNISHNLGKVPGLIIIKNLDDTYNWVVGHKSLGWDYIAKLNLNNEAQNYPNVFNSTEPTNSSFTVGSDNLNNADTKNHIAYVFAEIPGFSKFGSYIGNGSVNGPEINCGFKPQFVMCKCTTRADHWEMFDVERDGDMLFSNLPNAEIGPTRRMLHTDNGFKITTTDGGYNQLGDHYIYIAFGETLPAVVEPRGFAAQTYIGDSTSGHKVSGFGFQPDLVWLKSRDRVANHQLCDSVRGASNTLFPDLSGAGSYGVSRTESFDEDGFVLGSGQGSNNTGTNFISWAWKAGGAAVANNDGSLPSQVSVNTDTGFSIFNYTGNFTVGATVGHGLGTAPDFMLIKNCDVVASWVVYHKSLPVGDILWLNDSLPQDTVNVFYNTVPDDTILTFQSHTQTNGSGNNMIGYAWNEIKGYSKFGSYVGNGSTTGPVINCGFRPAFIMTKRVNAVGSWLMLDGLRGAGAGADNYLIADQNAAEYPANEWVEITDTGFTISTSDNGINTSGDEYIFVAFGGNVPTQESKSSNYALSTDGRTTWQVVQNEKGFETVTYTGDGQFARNINSVGFQPDLVWIKSRTTSNGSQISDSVRGPNNLIQSDTSGATVTDGWGYYLTAFNNDGYTIGNTSGANGDGNDIVSWCWKAGGPSVENTEGNITSQVSANQDLGFSIVSYNGTTNSNDEVGHGLNAVPDLMIFKNLAVVSDWSVYHKDLGAVDVLRLNTTDTATADANVLSGTAPTATKFTIGMSPTSNGAQGHIAYCWTSIPGFSSIGSYVGATDIQVDCGFEPAFVMIKRTNNISGWFMYDNSREDTGTLANSLFADISDAEITNANWLVELNATGFKLGGTGSSINKVGDSYIYIAFAKNVPQSLRNIVQNNTGTWEVNTNPTGTTWTDAAVLGAANTQEAALKKAFEYDFNQMSGDALKSAGSLLPTPGDTLDVAMEASDELSIENITFNYDANSVYDYLSLGTDYDLTQPDDTHLDITSNIAANIFVKVRK